MGSNPISRTRYPCCTNSATAPGPLVWGGLDSNSWTSTNEACALQVQPPRMAFASFARPLMFYYSFAMAASFLYRQREIFNADNKHYTMLTQLVSVLNSNSTWTEAPRGHRQLTRWDLFMYACTVNPALTGSILRTLYIPVTVKTKLIPQHCRYICLRFNIWVSASIVPI